MSQPEEPVEGECVVLVEAMSAYLDGSLPADERRLMDTHLGGCTGCRDFLGQLSAVPVAVAAARVQELPADVRATLLRAFTGT